MSREQQLPTGDTPLPHNPNAERAILGTILLTDGVPNSVLKVATEQLSVADFFLRENRRIFARMLELDAERRPIETITLMEQLKATGELEAVGGVAYLSGLPDGLPRVSSIGHYCGIVRENATRRNLAYAAQRLMEKSLNPRGAWEEISEELLKISALAMPSRNGSGLKAVTADAFLNMELPVREMMLEPILATQSLSLLYSKRGVGKTFFAIAIAQAIATGGKLFGWRAPKPRGVLFVDGELPARVLHDRISLVAKCTQAGTSLDRLRIVTPDLQSAPMPDLATREGQALVEARLDGVDLIILDNLSALCRAGKENESEGWLPVQEWALRLRQRGHAVLFIHHAGKAGAQRGTSRREDVLDLVVALRHPTDYSSSEGLRCELHFEKCRSLTGEATKPFEVRLEVDPTGVPAWIVRSADDALASRAAELFKEGVSVRDAAEELGISKSKAHRLKVKLERVSALE